MNRQRRSFGRFGPYPEHEIYEARRTLQMLFSNNRNRFVAKVIEKCRLTPPGQTFHRSDIWKKTQNDPVAIQEQACGSKHNRLLESSKKEPEATVVRPEEPKEVELVSKEQLPEKDNPYVLDNIYQYSTAVTVVQNKDKTGTNDQDQACPGPSTTIEKCVVTKSASTRDLGSPITIGGKATESSSCSQLEKPLFFLDRKGTSTVDVSVESKELPPKCSTSKPDSKLDCIVVEVNLADTRRISTVSQPPDTSRMASNISKTSNISNELVIVESDMEDEVMVIESETQEEVIPETTESEKFFVKLVCDFCGHIEKEKNTIKMKLHLASAKHSAASMFEGKMNCGKFEAFVCRKPECIKIPNVEYTNLVPLCPLCYSFFPSIWLCAAHYNDFHGLSGKTDCYSLGNIADTRTLVIKRDFTCDECSKVFGSQKALHTHWKSKVHYPFDIPLDSQVIICTCPYCRCFFSDFVQCRMHIIHSHGKQDNELALTVLYVEKPKVTQTILPVSCSPMGGRCMRKLEAKLKKCSNGKRDRIISNFFQRKERRKLKKKMSKLRKKKGDLNALEIPN